jgi:hypothetical protein
MVACSRIRDRVGMDIDFLAAAAAELAERFAALATEPALPGDSAMRWLDHREEAISLAELITAGLHLMRTPA